MRISWFIALGFLSLLLTGAGCSASVTTDSCSSDTTVTCASGDDGFSCTGSLSPTGDGDCTEQATAGTFCCTPGATIVIPGLPSTCASDDSVTGCAAPSEGFSCTGTDPPDATDSTLECSIGVSGSGGSLAYCCLTGETFAAGTCAQDDTIGTCTTAGSFGFKCASTDTPDQSDATLTCSAGVADADGTSTDFCCTAGGGTTVVVITGLPATCSADSTIATCTGGSAGYSCTGTDPPDAADSTLECSVGVVDGSSTDYCCLTGETFAAGTCAQDDTIGTCTTAGSFGFKCASTDTPDQSDATLTCSAGVADADGTSTDFCCTN